MSDAITKDIKVHRARVAGPKAGARLVLPPRVCYDAGAQRSLREFSAPPANAEKKKLADKKKKGISTQKSNPKARLAGWRQRSYRGAAAASPSARL
jgi:hypothetical protein